MRVTHEHEVHVTSVHVCVHLRGVFQISPQCPGVSVHPEGFDDCACMLSETRFPTTRVPLQCSAFIQQPAGPPSQELLFNQRSSDKSLLHRPNTLEGIYLCFWSALRGHSPTSSRSSARKFFDYEATPEELVCFVCHHTSQKDLGFIRGHGLFSHCVC